MNLTYTQNGDYLIPDLTMEETQETIGKYGMLRLSYLKENRPGLYTSMIVAGKLDSHLSEIDRTAAERLEQLMPELMKAEGVTESLKETDPMRWTGLMNTLKHQAEETLLAELINN